METSPVMIAKHQPERRRPPVTTAYCGCCCCCCCLHTVGSLVGAAVAPALGSGSRMPMTHYYDEDVGIDISVVRKPGLSAVTIFWWILCLLIFIGFAIGIVENRGGGDTLIITGVIMLMVFPGLQLASAVITLIVFACWPRYDKFYQLKQLGKITAGIVVGTIAGILAMVGIGVLMGAFR